ncbi:MAG TPA: hypothetical protein VFW63_05665 [Acidimicrobiales bacterium]|nr:hypothetical protein [Acidimicrobiales bacterium]
MTDPHDPQDESPSAAEREGIVDQQDAALAAIEEIEGADDEEGDGDPMRGPAPSG